MSTVGDARAVLIGAVLLIALEACGSSAPGTPPIAIAALPSGQPSAGVTTSALTPAPTPSPTLTQDQIRTAAGKAYLAAANTSNKASDALYKKYKNLNTLAEDRAYYKLSAAIDGRFLKALRSIAWPTDTAGDAHSLIVKDSAVQAAELLASVDKTFSDLNTDATHVNSAERSQIGVANLVRGDLGLPPVPVK